MKGSHLIKLAEALPLSISTQDALCHFHNLLITTVARSSLVRTIIQDRDVTSG